MAQSKTFRSIASAPARDPAVCGPPSRSTRRSGQRTEEHRPRITRLYPGWDTTGMMSGKLWVQNTVR